VFNTPPPLFCEVKRSTFKKLATLIISHQKKSKDSLAVNGKIEQNNQKDV
jgi:hypothetical protein